MLPFLLSGLSQEYYRGPPFLTPRVRSGSDLSYTNPLGLSPYHSLEEVEWLN